LYHLYLLEILAYLTQPHGCVAEQFGLLDLLVENLGKDHLEGHRDACLVQIFLEHFSLLLPSSRLVAAHLHAPKLTSYSPEDSFF
jgi:hypothetical protein